jgi:hypothetical protein
MRNRIVLALARIRALPAGRRRWMLVLALVAAILGLGRLDRLPGRTPCPERPQTQSEVLRWTGPVTLAESDGRVDAGGAFNGMAPVPRIAHAAKLAVATKEFARLRATLEEILERHRGYAARPRMRAMAVRA